MKRAWCVAAVFGVAVLPAISPEAFGASRTFTFEETEFGTADDLCGNNPRRPIFQRPGSSASTSVYIVPPSACGQGTLGGGNGSDSRLTAAVSASPPKSAELRFSWADPADDFTWARVTTSGSDVAFPNPTVYLGVGARIAMKIAIFGLDAAEIERVGAELEFFLLVRETGVLQPLGESGGTSGPIEFLGVDTGLGEEGNAPAGGVRISEALNPTFHTIEWVVTSPTEIQVSVDGGAPVTKPVVNFTGNGILDAANNRGTLEGLGIRKPADDDITKKWFVNIDDLVIDAPGVLDPVAIVSPVFQTATSITVVRIDPTASEVRLYKNDALLMSAEPPFNGSGGISHTFSPVSLKANDVLVATQVVDGVESEDSMRVTVMPPSLYVSLGVREHPDATGPVGARGIGSGATIEWVGSLTPGFAPKGYLLSLSPEWQTVVFDPADTTRIHRFIGNDILDSPAHPWYVMESLAFTIDPANPFAGPYTVYIDSIENDGIVFGGFEEFEPSETDGQVMFRSPGVSTSTQEHLKQDTSVDPPVYVPNVARVSDEAADTGSHSMKVQWEFVDNASTRWLRLTTSNTAQLGNPFVRLDQPVRVRLLLVPLEGLPCPTPFADADGDGDVDSRDFGVFQACITSGAEEPSVSVACRCFDHNDSGAGDGTIDLFDFDEFVKCATGPAVPWSQELTPDCVP